MANKYCGYDTEEELHEALIGNLAFQRKFMACGIKKLNSEYTYPSSKVAENFEFTCKHMRDLNACKWRCENCKLRAAYFNALDEIATGKRVKPKKRNDGRNKFTMYVNGNVKVIYTL